jgi:hypothetical protein
LAYFGSRLSSGSVATKAESKARTITVSIMAWVGEFDENNQRDACSQFQ